MRYLPTFLATIAAVACACLGPARAAHAGLSEPPRVGVIGDSLSDEYRFADDPPDRAAARNYVEILAAAGRLDFGAFATADRGEPRRQGHALNWARSTARTADLPAQTAGLARQAAAGQADYGVVLVGGNDFRDVAVGAADPATAVPAALANTVTAARTLLGATAATNPDFRLVVGNVVDITRTPAAQFLLAQDPSLGPAFAALRAGIDQYNAALAAQFAADERVAVLDVNGLFDDILDRPGAQVPGLTLEVTTPSADPGHLFVDPVHPGTVGQAVLANGLLDVLDERFGEDVRRLSAGEIRAAAAGPNAVPLPPAVWAGLTTLAGVGLAQARRRHARLR